MVSAYKTVSKRISTFIVDGKQHEFTIENDYAATTSSESKVALGAFLADWLLPHNASSLDAMLAPQSSTLSAKRSSSGGAVLVVAVMALGVLSF